MKKIGVYFLVILLSIVVFLFGFNYDSVKQPRTYYKVYLDSEYIGMIESKEELEKYINSQADTIKDNVKEYKTKLDAIDTYNKLYNKFDLGLEFDSFARVLASNKSLYEITDIDVDNLEFYIDNRLYSVSYNEIENMRNYVEENDIYNKVDNVYTPNGIEIKKVYTYENNITTIPEIYKKIIEKKSCTIAGYMFTIKSNIDGIDDITLYTIDTDVFSKAIENLITIFVDDKSYEAYKKDNQAEISTVGTIIENIYVEEEITYKAVNVAVEEKIYTDAKDLSAYLLYGDNFEQKIVQVKKGDSIESISFENEISVQEFLIFNDQYTSRDNMLATGSEVVISTIDPKIQIVIETYEIVDKDTAFGVTEQYDENLIQGNVVVTQEGQNGIERVTQNVKSVNGGITYIDPVRKQTIKQPIPKIISIGTKYIPNVGSTTSWGWPTESGYTFSSYFGYRPAVFGEGNWHSGLDIAGTGYGSEVRAANNGTIETITWANSYGNYIIINHNNGYYSVYGHMQGFKEGLTKGSTVARGDVIGYVGSTGWSTGPHLHFEIRTCAYYSCATNPLNYY